MQPRPLDRTARARALEMLESTTAQKPLDLLVIGGGVVGTAAALDAATRGLRVGLVEARDLAQGTSSRSSKLIHGGLRYLQMLDFKLVAEALRERNLLMTRTAPHLVRPLPFVFPFTRPLVDRAFIGSGVSLYDGLSLRASRGRDTRPPLHRHMSRKGLSERFPGLDGDKFLGGLEYFDAQVDDARLVLTLARSAHSLGVSVATQTEVTGYIRQAQQSPTATEREVAGVTVKDRETGREFTVHAAETMLAAGAWTGEQQDRAHSSGPGRSPAGLKVLASKGIHITVPAERIQAQERVGLISPTEKSVLFIIPMGRYWAIGTTDTAWHEPVDSPAPTAGDIDYVLAQANAVLHSRLTREDVIGTWAGLRPLLQPVATDEKSSAKISREHTVMRIAPGLSAVAGGKLTTYRSMAEDAVDFVTSERFGPRRSLTAYLPLLGAQGFDQWQRRAHELTAELGLSEEAVDRLLHRYGALLGELLELSEEDPSLLQEVTGAGGYLRAEFVYAARYEGALHLQDLLERRTRLFHEVSDRGLAALDEVADLVSAELGWDGARREGEKRVYIEYVEAYLRAELSTSDAEAARIMREAAPDYLDLTTARAERV
ncbi:glycerol-3-phosphate dehydrogenase/oxidase [Nesterenkonia alkaliphila]|uniref:FAD-dependent oxidoreductase n=1 Tax=Nesterenkonia alkaliphila TaxID=1463631 RepID=A0A7K1UHV6_9MICC|nr:glycerol-3-phosphate dehydrogenase/oxidase [Nesterenkonia alkaliphila]MVT26048.1 FAD-dependent oxidoreductase [Nesterenkonia alkaliphila]GFZ86345.1 glycerol-3-phosphate dehydrogenase [Nesterenkonia alkaliphila]